jgi:predicted nucleotidyltransferase
LRPVRLRDFVEDADGWIYAVSAYDNDERIGCVLRYVPDEHGERVNPSGRHYSKYDFDEAYALVARQKPRYAGLLHRIPHTDVKRVLRPDEELPRIMERHPRVKRLADLFNLPEGTIGCTGSLLCGLENGSSDIDMVVYGPHWFIAQE